jgi:hypothetical protein
LLDYADLDSNLHVVNDPFDGLTIRNGKIILPDRSGIGVITR